MPELESEADIAYLRDKLALDLTNVEAMQVCVYVCGRFYFSKSRFELVDSREDRREFEYEDATIHGYHAFGQELREKKRR